jgi:hypothetical protein
MMVRCVASGTGEDAKAALDTASTAGTRWAENLALSTVERVRRSMQSTRWAARSDMITKMETLAIRRDQIGYEHLLATIFLAK